MTGCPILRQKLCDDGGKRCNGIGDMNTAAVKRAGDAMQTDIAVGSVKNDIKVKQAVLTQIEDQECAPLIVFLPEGINTRLAFDVRDISDKVKQLSLSAVGKEDRAVRTKCGCVGTEDIEAGLTIAVGVCRGDDTGLAFKDAEKIGGVGKFRAFIRGAPLELQGRMNWIVASRMFRRGVPFIKRQLADRR